MTQELIERLEPCPFCRSQMQLGLQMFKHPAMDDGECPLQDLAFRNELAGAWNTRDQSQSARIAELRDGLEDAASCLKEAGHTISRLERGKIGERNFAYVAAEHAASLTKDSTSG